MIAIAVAAALAATIDPSTAVIGGLLAVPTFVLIRLASSCALNPTSSAYLIRWPRPVGALPLHAADDEIDPLDIELAAAGFISLGTFTEWGGSVLSVSTNRQDTLALSSGDQLVLLSGLDDGRLCVSTTHLVPPHDRLVVNHHAGVDAAALVAAHTELAGLLVASGIGAVEPEIEQVRHFLSLEWDIWQEIGPFVGPFVRVGANRQPSLILARVASADILERARPGSHRRAAEPLEDRTARPAQDSSWPVVALAPARDDAEATAEDDLAATLIDILEREGTITPPASPAPTPPASPAPTPPETPAREVRASAPRGLSALAEQAARAAKHTDRALAAGESQPTAPTDPGGDR